MTNVYQLGWRLYKAVTSYMSYRNREKLLEELHKHIGEVTDKMMSVAERLEYARLQSQGNSTTSLDDIHMRIKDHALAQLAEYLQAKTELEDEVLMPFSKLPVDTTVNILTTLLGTGSLSFGAYNLFSRLFGAHVEFCERLDQASFYGITPFYW